MIGNNTASLGCDPTLPQSQVNCPETTERIDRSDNRESTADLVSLAEEQAREESSLIAAAQCGHPRALDELLNRHRAVVFRAARRVARNREEAEDLVQETMLRAIENLGRFRNEARFSSWLVAIAVNAAISLRRREARFRHVSLDESGQSGEISVVSSVPDQRPNPEQEYSQKERQMLVRRAFLKQHRTYQTILHACYHRDAHIAEAAQALGITQYAAKSRLFRARRLLMSAVREHTRIRKLP